MKVHMKINTGQGITIEGTLDPSELPRNLAQRMEKILQLDLLAAAASITDHPDMVDMQQYEITLMPNDRSQEAERFQFTDAGCSEEMLELLDDLVHQVIIGKKRRSK